MYKKVFLDHWIDWTIAIIIMVFIVVYGAVVQFNIEQEGDNNNNLSNSITIPKNIPLHQASTSTADTVNWQTYSNNEFGFSIKYPKEWQLMDSFNGLSIATKDSPKFGWNVEVEENLSNIIVTRRLYKSTVAFSNYVKDVSKYGYLPAPIPFSQYGFQGYQIVVPSDIEIGQQNEKLIFFKPDDVTVIEAVIIYTDDLEEQTESVFDAMLSTLRFSAFRGSETRLYHNEQLGFEFRYPSNLAFRSSSDTAGGNISYSIYFSDPMFILEHPFAVGNERRSMPEVSIKVDLLKKQNELSTNVEMSLCSGNYCDGVNDKNENLYITTADGGKKAVYLDRDTSGRRLIGIDWFSSSFDNATHYFYIDSHDPNLIKDILKTFKFTN